MPSIPRIVEALEAAYDRGQERSQKAIDFAKGYQADAVYEKHWKPSLEILAQRSVERPSA
jgi:hypothetical protein